MKKKKYIIRILLLLFLPFHNICAQWMLDSNGLGNIGVLSLAPAGINIIAGTLGNGTYRSTNNGLNWTQTSLNSQKIWTLAAIGNDNIFAGTDGNMGVYESTDNGQNWSQVLINQTVWSLASSGNYIYAGTENNGVLASTNSGANWSQTLLNTHSVHALAADGNYVYAGTFNFGVFISSDHGVSWMQSSLGAPNIINALLVSGNNIFAGTQTGGVYLSSNNGASWTQTALNNAYVRSLTFRGIAVFAGVQNEGVYITVDTGKTWYQRNEGLGNSSVDALLVLNAIVFAGTEDGSLNSVYSRPISELIGIQQISEQVPAQFSLDQNYPNPFNPATKIRFALQKNSEVRLVIFDMLGREVETLVNEQLNAGTYEVNWSAEKYSSAVYYYKLVVGDAIGTNNTNNARFSETKKMVLIK